MKTVILFILSLSVSAMDLTATLKVEEGFSAKVYKDHLGYDTIGFGHRCEKNHPNVTKIEAEKILANDIKIAMSKVDSLVGKNAPQEVKEIVTAMCFQLGYAGVKKFKLMIKKIKAMDYKKASKEMLNSEWYKQTPSRVERLAKLMSAVK